MRFYSLHRAYGMSPDPVEALAQRPMVLIGPPDHGAAARTRIDGDQDPSQDGDADQDGGDGGKPAVHGHAASDGQSGDN